MLQEQKGVQLGNIEKNWNYFILRVHLPERAQTYKSKIYGPYPFPVSFLFLFLFFFAPIRVYYITKALLAISMTFMSSVLSVPHTS